MIEIKICDDICKEIQQLPQNQTFTFNEYLTKYNITSEEDKIEYSVRILGKVADCIKLKDKDGNNIVKPIYNLIQIRI